MVNRTVHPDAGLAVIYTHCCGTAIKIRRYLKTYEREINCRLGRERLDFALKAAGAAGVDPQIEELLHSFCSEEPLSSTVFKKYATTEDVYVAIGREDLQLKQVLVPYWLGSWRFAASA